MALKNQSLPLNTTIDLKVEFYIALKVYDTLFPRLHLCLVCSVFSCMGEIPPHVFSHKWCKRLRLISKRVLKGLASQPGLSPTSCRPWVWAMWWSWENQEVGTGSAEIAARVTSTAPVCCTAWLPLGMERAGPNEARLQHQSINQVANGMFPEPSIGKLNIWVWVNSGCRVQLPSPLGETPEPKMSSLLPRINCCWYFICPA